jgi:phosphotransferase system enzyme I (PtsP)
VVTELLNDDIDAELKRLEEALGSLRISIDDMLSRRDVSMEGEHRAVLEAYRMFAHDRGWVRKLEEAIRNGLTCEAAVEKVQSDTRARMIHMTDSYLRERLHDFDDLANRLLRQLTGFVPGGKGCRRMRSSLPAPWGQRNCLIIRARRSAGLFSKMAPLPAMW